MGVLNWLDIGAAPPRRVTHELDSVRDAGVSNRFPGFVTPTLLHEYYGVPETTAGSADVYGGLENGTSASLVSTFDSVAKSLSLQDTIILASLGDDRETTESTVSGPVLDLCCGSGRNGRCENRQLRR